MIIRTTTKTKLGREKEDVERGENVMMNKIKFGGEEEKR